MGCFVQGNKVSEHLLWMFDMRRVKPCPFGCSRLCKAEPCICPGSAGQAGAASAAESLEAPGWDFFITLGSHFPPHWRSWLGMNGEPFFLPGTMGQEQMETPSGVPRTAWLGPLKRWFGKCEISQLHFSYFAGVWWFLLKFKTWEWQKEMTGNVQSSAFCNFLNRPSWKFPSSPSIEILHKNQKASIASLQNHCAALSE